MPFGLGRLAAVILLAGAGSIPSDLLDAKRLQEAEADPDATHQAVEAAIARVEEDVGKMEKFGEDVKRNLLEQDKVAQGVRHALAAFRQQQDLDQESRDQGLARSRRLEDEVTSLQRRIQSLEADKATLTDEKKSLAEANSKVLAQVSSMFNYGQAVQTSLAYKGLAEPSVAANTSTS